MKIIISLALLVCIIIYFTRCNQKPAQELPSSNPDSVKKTIIALNDEIIHSISNPEKYQLYCEDSLMVVGDGEFKISANEISHDLHAYSVVPYDYSFKLFGNTAILSYRCTRYEVFNNDTLFHSARDLKTFVFNNGKWKLVSYSFGFEPVNYFRPVAEINNKYYPLYSGVYKVNDSKNDTFFVKDGKLYDKITGSDAVRDFPINDSEYMIQGDLARIVFGKDSKGKVAYITTIEQDGQKTVAPKIK